MSTLVTGTFANPRFLGVKDIDPMLKKRNEELTDEELWEKILGGGYEQPYCPDCHFKMLVAQFIMEYQLRSPYMVGKNTPFSIGSWNVQTNPPVVKIEMQCPNCRLLIKGIGMGLRFEGDSYYLAILKVIEKQRADIPWPFQI